MRSVLVRWRWLIAGGLAAAIALTAGLLLIPGHDRKIPPARTRSTIAFTVCVLTDQQGLTSSLAASVWRGVMTAQAATNLKAQTLQTAGRGHLPDAVVALNTLAQRSCGLVVAVGQSETAAVQEQAKVFPRQWFLIVAPGSSQSHNVAAVTDRDPNAIAKNVAAIAGNAAHHRFTAGN